MKVAQLCLTLCNRMDYTVHGILQARILEWVAFPFSRGSSQPRDRTQVSHVAGGFFTSWATGEGQEAHRGSIKECSFRLNGQMIGFSRISPNQLHSRKLLKHFIRNATSSQSRNQTRVSCIAGRFLPAELLGKSLIKFIEFITCASVSLPHGFIIICTPNYRNHLYCMSEESVSCCCHT